MTEDTPAVDFNKPEAQLKKEQGVALYMNISSVKLHTSAGIIWPRQECVLPDKEAKAWGDKVVKRS